MLVSPHPALPVISKWIVDVSRYFMRYKITLKTYVSKNIDRVNQWRVSSTPIRRCTSKQECDAQLIKPFNVC